MRRLGLVIVLALLATACDRVGGAVAVVNLDSVARALGKDTAAEQQINAKGQELQGQLQQAAKLIGDKLQAEQAKTADPQQKQALQQQAQAAFNQQTQQAQQLLAQYRAKLATDFRNEVKVAAQKIAEKNGYSMVVTDQVAVYFKPDRDITDEVTKGMRGTGAAAPAGGAAASAKH